jgi:hypothetical protein
MPRRQQLPDETAWGHLTGANRACSWGLHASYSDVDGCGMAYHAQPWNSSHKCSQAIALPNRTDCCRRHLLCLYCISRRSRSQLMVSAVWDPSSSRSKLLSSVTPKKLWRKEGAVPLSLSVCLSMCLVPEQQQQQQCVTAASGFSVLSSVPSGITGFSTSTGVGNPSTTDGSVASFYSCASSFPAGSAAAAGVQGVGQQQGLGRGFGMVEPVWVNSELVVRVCPADASFAAVRVFR